MTELDVRGASPVSFPDLLHPTPLARIDAHEIHEDLRLGADYSPWEPKTHFAFAADAAPAPARIMAWAILLPRAPTTTQACRQRVRGP